MAFQSPNVTELKAEEARCLAKIDNRRKSEQRADPRLSYSEAYAKALAAMPNVYSSYCNARRELSALGVPPMTTTGE
jgi:hypothetical protein